MKTALLGLFVVCILLVAPAYAECGGSGYEPFLAEVDAEVEVVFAFNE